ncbi:hypothetical protein PSACC_01679 [Paramicrosporidium saccamoebae]|uniref:Calcineurin-like phosphoesterase domain-containing protein n=1 Tax=Paramicrosporidium saccamoebae TaxID=1246581 RepID=A0A2H9TL97_9FUNG|nr:hypothetical protein PSACC_01679 [Paramicrosporidium saccamoebae]
MVDTSTVMIMWETNCRYDDVELLYKRRPAYRSGPKQQLIRDADVEHRFAADSMEFLHVGPHRFVHRVYFQNLISDSFYDYIVRLVPDDSATQRRHKGRTTGEKTPFSATFYHPGDLVETLSVGIVSDSHGGSETFTQLLRSLSKRRPDLFLHVGDMVNQGKKRFEWQVFFFDALTRSGMSSKVPSVITMGNHDLSEHGASDYLAPTTKLSKNRAAYYYAFSAGPVRFIVLDCNSKGDEQIQWLEAELAAIPTQRSVFRIITIHSPPFVEYWDAESWRGGENKWAAMIRSKMVPLFEKYHVDLVLSGHQHNYQRGFRNGVHYVICGGGGGMLDTNRVEDHHVFKKTSFVHHYLHLDITKTEITIKAYGVDRREFDQLTIPKNVVRRYRAADP